MRKQSVLFIMMLTMLLDFVGLFMVIPIFAPLLLDPNSSMLAHSTQAWMRTTIVGFLVASYGLGQLWGGPFLGELSDQFGRKKVLIFGLIFLVIANFLGVVSFIIHSLTMLFICRFLTGFASGNASVLFAMVTHMNHDDKERGVQLGYLTGACAVGAVIGPIFGANLVLIHGVPWVQAATPFLVMSIAFLLNIFLVVTQFIDNVEYKRRPLHPLIGFKNIVECITIPKVNLLLAAYFFFVLSTETLFAGLPIFTVEKFHVTTTWLGALFGVSALFSAFSSLYLNKKISHVLKSYQIVLLTLVILLLSYIGLLLPKEANGIFIPYSIVGLTCVLAWAHFNAIIGGSVAKEIQGKVMGVAQSLLSLAILIGPSLMGLAVAKHHNVVILICSVSGILALICLIKYRKAQNCIPE